MNTWILIWRDLWLRKSRLVSALMAISLGIGVIVGIRSVSSVSEKAVALKLDNLGANILVLPQGASVGDYYSADIDAPTFPEGYVERLRMSMLPGVDNLSPKLTRRIMVGDVPVVLTGILPRNELASKPIWQSASLTGINLATACASGAKPSGDSGNTDERAKRRAIEALPEDEVLVGSMVARRLGLSQADKVRLAGRAFSVASILPETGTVDDDRIFSNLHVVQRLLGVGPQVSAIEVMGCCSAISDGLLGKMRNLLPDTRITTIGQIVSTQIETNQLMERVSVAFLVLIVVVGAVSIGNFMWANVEERRREIGTLITVGATRPALYKLFFVKPLVLGVAGGAMGFVFGTVAAMILGPYLAGIQVAPVAMYLPLAIAVAVGIALLGSIVPVYRAVRLDPAEIMQEI